MGMLISRRRRRRLEDWIKNDKEIRGFCDVRDRKFENVYSGHT